jgi:hypothetical protein
MVTCSTDNESVGANNTVLLLGDSVDHPFTCRELDKELG